MVELMPLAILGGTFIGVILGYCFRSVSTKEQHHQFNYFMDWYEKGMKDKEIKQLKDIIVRLEKELEDEHNAE